MKKTKKTDLFTKIVAIVVCFISAALIISATIMLSNHTNEILLRSQTEAENLTLDSIGKIENKIDNYTSYVSTTSGSFQKCNNKNEVEMQIEQIKLSSFTERGLKNVRYFLNGEIYGVAPWPVEITKDIGLDYVKSVEHSKQEALFLGTNFDEMPEIDKDKAFPVDLYEFYSPVYDNGNIDGVALYFDTTVFRSQIGNDFRHDNAVLSALVRDTGNVLIGDETFQKNTVIDILNELGVNETDITSRVFHDLTEHNRDRILCKINGLNHVISIEFNSATKDLGVVEVYDCGALAKETNDLINAIVAILVIFIVIIIATITLLVINRYRLQRKVNNAEKHDLLLDCLNKYGFTKEAEDILHRESGVYYGVIVLHIRHFKFLTENYGDGEVNSLLNYIKLTLTKTCRIEEVYGHGENGEFLLLLHAKDKEDLIDRLKIHSFLASQYKGAHKFDVAIKYGIYEYQSGDQSPVSKMIEYAIEANNTVTKATVENVDMQFNFYDDELRKIRLINDDMELRQETALRDGEFQVFYQAKYNLKNHKQDGAEALVRWYDKNTGEYNKPALFMPLFESNGFIEKLDKYVYTKVCEYISYSLQQGRNVFPVSVNVSRITATQPDFVDYYTRIKKKYGIANGALTIEFTESFAYENYDVLKSIVDRLHKAGFKTSIDDFGCGYSSYRILKELPMDEIKLDKFFIDYSENPDRINSIFESVIALAKKLNMKVTQEGVEREEDVELLKKLGCDVIQGYIYSHPLSLTDYLHFVENTKDHNL